MSRRSLLTSAVGLVVVIGAATVATTTDALSSGTDAGSESTAASASFDTVDARRGDLSVDREFKASISFGDSWTVTTAAAGTITSQNLIGTIVGFGETLIRIDDKPLFLAQGAMPMYRELFKVDTRQRDLNGKRLELLTGLDVGQLQSFLLDGGFDADGKLEADGIFGDSTVKAVKAWQEAVGLPITGRVDSAQIVFAPDPVRIASDSRVGAGFLGLEVNNAESSVLIDTSNRDRGALPVGSSVRVTPTNATTLVGVVDDQEQVSGADGSLVWRTTITVDEALPGDTSTATVVVTETLAEDVLIVPVGALLALAEGGFAVEVPTQTGTNLVRVEVGEVLDGQAEISGDVAVGDQIVMPT